MALDGVRISVFVLIFVLIGTTVFGFRLARVALVHPNVPAR